MATLLLFLYLLYNSSVMGRKCLPTGHLIGGSSTNIQCFPFQVSIRETATNSHLCGGAIITEKFVLTAAHCICNSPTQITDSHIVVGSTQLSVQGNNYTIEHAICHAKYNSKVKLFDIGIIGIKNKIIFNEHIKPIKILTNELPVGTIVTVSGWGYTSYPNAHQPNTLQMLRVPIISLQECKEAYKRYKTATLSDTQICTLVKVRRASTCKGDSGGPVTINGVLVGLVSWGVPCALGKPDTNTKVSKYVEWIKTTINLYCQSYNCPENNLYPKFMTAYKKRKFSSKRFNKLIRMRKRRPVNILLYIVKN